MIWTEKTLVDWSFTVTATIAFLKVLIIATLTTWNYSCYSQCPYQSAAPVMKLSTPLLWFCAFFCYAVSVVGLYYLGGGDDAPGSGAYNKPCSHYKVSEYTGCLD